MIPYKRVVEKSVCLLILITLTVTLFPLHNVRALESNAGCKTAEIVFVRGSGQGLADRDAKRFFDQIDSRLNPNTSTHKYELGTEFYGGNKYPAVSISPWENKLNAAVPWLKANNAQYTDSVKAGEGELRTYLAQRVANCPTSRFVIGGYSQGAQVVGNVLPYLSQSIKSKIAFVSLFGDPKLYLPEGAKLWDGCAGRNMSPWRRGNPLCYVHSGISMAREPYIPKDMIGRVGSWCDKKDFVCTGSATNLIIGNTHSKYVEKGYVDQAAREIAGKFIKSSIINPASVSVSSSIKPTIRYAVSPSSQSDDGTVLSRLFNRLKTIVAGSTAASQNVSLANEIVDSSNITLIPTVDEFYAKPGEEITFDVLMSYNEDRELFTKYDWDFNNDGIVDKTTRDFYATHTYSEAFEGTASVRAYIATGESNTTQFTVHVGETVFEDLLPSLPTDLQISQQQTADTKAVTLSWNAATNATAYSVYVGGEVVGYVDANTTSITLTEVPNDVEQVFGVSASNDVSSSEVATVSVPVLVAPPVSCPAGQIGTPPNCTAPPVTPPTPAPKPLSPACKALIKLKPYLPQAVYRILWKALRCD